MGVRKIVVIIGPTATGKTELALKLCQKFSGEIVSVDSRQAYWGMEIGTGKKVKSEKLKVQNDKAGIKSGLDVPIHLYDFVSPGQQLNAYDYSLAAWEKMEEIWERGKVPFLVGGTGFYLDIILGRRRLSGTSVDPRLRLELEALTRAELVERLKRISPEKLGKVDIYNKYRLIRAIEIALSFGHAELGSASGSQTLKRVQGDSFFYKSLIIGLTAENQFLYQRANERVDFMVKEGLVEEVRGLVKKYSWEAPGLKALGYGEFRPSFEGLVQLNEAIQKIKYNTHAYIRRQKTYFKKFFADASWFDISQPGFDREVEKEVESFLMR